MVVNGLNILFSLGIQNKPKITNACYECAFSRVTSSLDNVFFKKKQNHHEYFLKFDEIFRTLLFQNRGQFSASILIRSITTIILLRFNWMVPIRHQWPSKIKSNPAGIFLLKVNNRNARIRCKICSKLIIKTPERRQMTSFWCLYC